MESKENKVFKIFILLTTLISAFVIYFLMIRPLKIVVTTEDTTTDPIVFTYEKNEVNPDLEIFKKRSLERGHVIVVLLGPKRKLLTNQKYDLLLMGFSKCNDILPCEVLKIPKSEFESKARARKDVK
jgi:hypothetical protein